MNPSRLVFCLLFTGAVAATAGERLSCPDLATATPVGNCPSESDLQYTFTGYCSDDRRMYQQDTCLLYTSQLAEDVGLAPLGAIGSKLGVACQVVHGGGQRRPGGVDRQYAGGAARQSL